MLQHFTTHRFSLCDAQCVEHFWFLSNNASSCTIWFTFHCCSSTIVLKEILTATANFKLDKYVINNGIPSNSCCSNTFVKPHKYFLWWSFIKIADNNGQLLIIGNICNFSKDRKVVCLSDLCKIFANQVTTDKNKYILNSSTGVCSISRS